MNSSVHENKPRSAGYELTELLLACYYCSSLVRFSFKRVCRLIWKFEDLWVDERLASSLAIEQAVYAADRATEEINRLRIFVKSYESRVRQNLISPVNG